MSSPLESFNQVANRALVLYPGLFQGEVEILNYSENATYLVKATNGEKFVLRVCRPGYHLKSAIETEIYWIRSIHENTSVEVSTPIAGKNGEYIQTVTLENDPQQYHCILFTFLEGEQPDVDDDSKLLPIYEKIGEIAAHFHNHSIRNSEKFSTLERQTWDCETILGQIPIWGRWQDGVDMTPERIELFEKVSNIIIQRLDRFGKGRERFGLMHSDLRHANLLVDGDRVKVIDFDDMGFSWYLYDLASSLTFLEHRPFAQDLIKAWVKGYRKIRDLSEEEENEIPTFIMLRRLQVIAWLGSHKGTETAEEFGSDHTGQSEILARNYLADFAIKTN